MFFIDRGYKRAEDLIILRKKMRITIIKSVIIEPSNLRRWLYEVI